MFALLHLILMPLSWAAGLLAGLALQVAWMLLQLAAKLLRRGLVMLYELLRERVKVDAKPAPKRETARPKSRQTARVDEAVVLDEASPSEIRTERIQLEPMQIAPPPAEELQAESAELPPPLFALPKADGAVYMTDGDRLWPLRASGRKELRA